MRGQHISSQYCQQLFSLISQNAMGDGYMRIGETPSRDSWLISYADITRFMEQYPDYRSLLDIFSVEEGGVENNSVCLSLEEFMEKLCEDDSR